MAARPSAQTMLTNGWMFTKHCISDPFRRTTHAKMILGMLCFGHFVAFYIYYGCIWLSLVWKSNKGLSLMNIIIFKKENMIFHFDVQWISWNNLYRHFRLQNMPSASFIYCNKIDGSDLIKLNRVDWACKYLENKRKSSYFQLYNKISVTKLCIFLFPIPVF